MKSEISMNFLNEKQQIIFPTRIVKVGGMIENTANLLVKKPIAILSTTNEGDLTMLKKENGSEAYVLLDFGRELQGSLRLVTPRTAPLNLKLRLVFGESVSEALSRVDTKGATNDHSPRDIEVLVSNLSVLDFGRTGFRFCKIELVDDGAIWFKNIVAVSKTADIQKKGYIKTSDPRYDEILDTALYTAYLNVQDGVIWDGIKRDRLVWSGDLNSEILALGYNYGAIPHIKNCLSLLKRETPADRWMNNIPSYNAWWILNLIDYYYLSGDLDYFTDNVEFVNLLLSDFDKCIGDSDVDFTRTGKNTGNPFFLDWPTANTENGFIGAMMLILYTMQKLRLVDFCGIDYGCVESIAGKLEKYRASAVSAKETLAMQIVCGARDSSHAAALELGGPREFSTFMMYFIMKAMDIAGSDKTLELAKKYYGGMLDRGATSFWEDFQYTWLEGSGRIDEETPEGVKDLHADYGRYCYTGLRHSLCHGWSSGIVGYTVENVLGLKIIEPGYSKISVKPMLNGLDWIKADIPTPHGKIHISVRRGEKTFIKLPEGVELVESDI